MNLWLFALCCCVYFGAIAALIVAFKRWEDKHSR